MRTEQENTRTRPGPAPMSGWRVSNSLRRTLVVALLVVTSLSASRPSAACCPPAEPVAASMAEAEVVFVGTVLSTANHDRVAQVRVEEVWKGPALPQQVEVRGGPSPELDNAATSVDRNFRVGLRYLFVPRAGSASAAAKGLPVLEDGLCTATQEYHMNLDALRPPSDPAARGKVHGDAPPSDNAARVPVLPLAVAVAAAVAVGAALGAAARRAYKLDA